jgi:hypothetical protein
MSISPDAGILGRLSVSSEGNRKKEKWLDRQRNCRRFYHLDTLSFEPTTDRKWLSAFHPGPVSRVAQSLANFSIK